VWTSCTRSRASAAHRFSYAAERGRAQVNAVASCGVDAWTFIWLMVFLKIPIVALFLIVRWAVRQTPESASGEDGGIGPRAGPLHPHHPRPRPPGAVPRLPRVPRRGPHGDPPLIPPSRLRTVVARGRLAQR
jgi:hypothetical protein